jgi:hypothetical protein
MEICIVQFRCPHFESGDNKPPNEHVRFTVPCMKFINSTCETPSYLAWFFGEPDACNIADRNEKLRRAREDE